MRVLRSIVVYRCESRKSQSNMSSVEMPKTQVEPSVPLSLPEDTNSSRTASIEKLAEEKIVNTNASTPIENNEKKPKRQRRNAKNRQIANPLVQVGLPLPVPVERNIPSLLHKVMKVCRDFIHNICPRGNECPSYHPPMEINDGVTEKGTWFAVCPKIPPQSCDCSFFHVSERDKERYQQEGEISPELVQKAVHKCLVENLTLVGSELYCKAFLRGLCNLKNCHFQHLSQKQYEDEVFYEMKDELAYLFIHSESFPKTADGIQQPEDMKMKHQVQYNFPNDPNILMQEIHELRSEYISTRRNLEEQVDVLGAENSQLRTQVQAFHTANTALNEEIRQAQEAARQLENDKCRLQKILDGNVSNATAELKKLLEDAKKDAERAREAFSNVNADMMIQCEIEKRKLIAEINYLKNQLQDFQNPAARGEDVQRRQ
ncbi:hypothetical protein Pcinc_026032 [Petrolisthes cinctipes]|uniref:C3H1-type domain-containing protein n=1 Tax=Petrolisthes cinctipes TaxID=88211 RepID=A0AAE1KB02_PETCI|nr:hypothetical protein Pcinc_026032 [Petrolisthes cinctipes]